MRIFLAFASIYLIWGSTYAFIALAIESIPPFFMLGMRFVAAGILLGLYCLIKKIPFPSRELIYKNALAGILMLGIGTGAVAWVEQYITSGLAAILIAAAPLWYVVLDRNLWGFHFKNKRILAGLFVGLIGMAVLFADEKTFDFNGDKLPIISALILMCGSITWVSGALFTKYRIKEGSPLVNSTIQMTIAGLALFVTGFAFNEHLNFSMDQITQRSFYALIYLTLFGSLVAFVAYLWLLTVRPPSVVGTYALVNPVAAVFFGWLLASEPVLLHQVAGLIVILSGVVLVLFTKKPELKEAG